MGAQTWIVISDSLNPDSNALYAKYGMFQWIPLLALHGSVPKKVEVGNAIQAKSLRRNDSCFSALDALDKTVLGITRRVDHELWLGQPDLAGLLFHAGEQAVGYAHVSAKGEIGPLAVHDSAVLPAVLALCLRHVQALGAAEASFKFPSSCHEGLAYLLSLGFRFHNILLLDASQPFGRLENYFVSVGDALF